MATPGKPRHTGIPTPGRASGLPAPGRLRSASAAGPHTLDLPSDTDAINRAFTDAIRSNNPAQHRVARELEISPTIHNRRTDSTGPPSIASASFGIHGQTPGARAKTPIGARPRSRQSENFQPRSTSRADWAYIVGDNVRIESLGFEGTLRYLGAIDEKPGVWAGVELSGGFSGKGKNEGSVNGKRYFTCPPKCGVFVASTKLSPPTVGPGAIPRSSSSASSLNGRVTPSFSNGRVTPTSSGRITPGFTTPSARFRTPGQSRNSNFPSESTKAQSKITAGSRASRYLGMTAKHLSLRDTGPTVGTATVSLDSASKGFGSPVRIPSSPTKTPKPLSARPSNLGVASTTTTPSKKGRTSLATPRARLPSAVVMPPPASPSTSSSRSVSGADSKTSFSRSSRHDDTDDSTSLHALQSNSRALQEKMALLLASGRITPASPSRSHSSISNSASDNFREIESLQALIVKLNKEKEHLNEELKIARVQLTASASSVEGFRADVDAAHARISNLESSTKQMERFLRERDSKIESLERSAQLSVADMDRIRNDGESRTRELQSKLDGAEQLMKTLKEALDAKEGAESQNDSLMQAKNAEITMLETRVQKAYADLELERRDLGSQVDELRHAGQETIALYEERLSAADGEKYDLQEKVLQLEEKMRNVENSSSPAAAAAQLESAAQIDNETLREQVRHLQNKIGVLEDSLEDARANAEREEGQIHDRLKRYKDKEETLRKELRESRTNLDNTLRAEGLARGRVEEVEEAMRESTNALENARAEIETLRSELANYEALSMGDSPDASNRLAESTSSRIANERSRMAEEMSELRDRLESSRLIKRQIMDELSGTKAEIEEANKALASLRDIIENLDSEKAALEVLNEDRESKLVDERKITSELRQALEDRMSELDSTRKSQNRDRPLTVTLPDTARSPSPSSSDETAGLKHIVQELQREISASSQRNKVLESENRVLLSETDQLREELKVLEDNIEASILREEKALDVQDGSIHFKDSSSDISALQKTVKDLRSKHEAEIDQLKKRLAESEMKNTRMIHDLNKEISELESLVESKIYREDELERELERLKDKMSRSSRKSTKGSSEPPESTSSRPSLETIRSTKPSASSAAAEEVCEICEQPGHDIFSCHLLKDDAPPQRTSSSRAAYEGRDPSTLFCDECESHGHVATDCPHSMDVF